MANGIGSTHVVSLDNTRTPVVTLDVGDYEVGGVVWVLERGSRIVDNRRMLEKWTLVLGLTRRLGIVWLGGFENNLTSFIEHKSFQFETCI